MEYTNIKVKVSQKYLGRYIERLIKLGSVITYTSYKEAIVFNEKLKAFYFITVAGD